MVEMIAHSDAKGVVIPTAPAAPPVLAFSGYASLWGVADLNGDVVQRGAFARSLERTGVAGVRMLHNHESRSPVGVWDRIAEDERGLFVAGRLEDWSAESRFARALVRAGALDGLSIGFRSRKARREARLRVLEDVELWEVSLVTFPMLPGARLSVTTAASSVGMSPQGECTQQSKTRSPYNG